MRVTRKFLSEKDQKRKYQYHVCHIKGESAAWGRFMREIIRKGMFKVNREFLKER